MQFRRIIVLSLLMATAVAQTAAGQSKDERAIRAAGEAWQRWVAEQKTDSIVALFTPEGTMLLGNSPPVRGSAALREGWGGLVKSPGLSLHWTPTRIDVVSPRVAHEYGT